MKNLAMACGLAILLASDGAVGALVAYEGFDYSANADINGLNGGEGFSGGWTDVWEKSGITGQGLVFSGLQTSGFALHADSPADALIGRMLSSSFAGTNGSETWFSFLLNAASLSDESHAIMWLRPAGNSFTTYARFGVFHRDKNQFFGIGTNADERYSNIPFLEGETYLIVGSISWNAAGNETLSLYINPSSGSGAPTPSFSTSDFNLTAGVSRIQLRTDGSGAWTYDEIRLGGSFADVVPVPEVSTSTMFLLALSLLMRRRSA
jgi:hypothetical protein